MLMMRRIALVAVLLTACEATVGPAPADETLTGWLTVFAQTGEPISPPDVTITVRNALDETTSLSVRGDGSWVGDELGPEPYTVTAEAEGFVGLPVEEVGGGERVHARMVERSTIQVLRVDEAVLTAPGVCATISQCLDLRFTVAEDGAFPDPGSRLVFRVFVGDSDVVTPEQFRETRFLVVSPDDPGLERGETEMTIDFGFLRGLDWESMDLSRLSVYLVGATENQHGLWGSDIEGLGWPELAETGAGAEVTR